MEGNNLESIPSIKIVNHLVKSDLKPLHSVSVPHRARRVEDENDVFVNWWEVIGTD